MKKQSDWLSDRRSDHQLGQQSIMEPRSKMDSIRGSTIADRIACIDHGYPVDRGNLISDRHSLNGSY